MVDLKLPPLRRVVLEPSTPMAPVDPLAPFDIDLLMPEPLLGVGLAVEMLCPFPARRIPETSRSLAALPKP